MTRIIVAQDRLNCEHLVGKFLDESHFDVLIEEDCDFYAPNNSLTGGDQDEANCVFKFRKGTFSQEEQQGASEGLIDAAVESQNRGMAAGPKGGKLGKEGSSSGRDWVTGWQLAVLDALQNPTTRLDGRDEVEILIEGKGSFKEDSARGIVWLRSKIVATGENYDGFFDKWLNNLISKPRSEWAPAAADLIKTCISNTSYANPVNSGIAGFFDRYPRYPYGRVCSYNWKNPEQFEKSFPYLRKLDREFAALLPQRYLNQRLAANKLDNRFLIGGDTVFTTLTINKSFRTAAHRDAGDLGSGFSNLGVVSTGKDFRGGYLVLPEFRAAVSIRPGDLLLISNHDVIHGNTPIESVTGNPEDLERMSIVAYFRENMLQLGSWDYETARRDFVESRRMNQQHPLWRPLWNGVSEKMFDQQEWYDFLAAKEGGEAMLDTYHAGWRSTNQVDLSEFFL